jgi:hypothetical protein
MASASGAQASNAASVLFSGMISRNAAASADSRTLRVILPAAPSATIRLIFSLIVIPYFFSWNRSIVLGPSLHVFSIYNLNP